MKRRGREKRTLLLIKARRRAALGWTPRKRKSFRCHQIPSLQAPIRYTKTNGTVRKSSGEKPKRTCLTSMEGASGAAIYSKDWIQAKPLCARGQKKKGVLRIPEGSHKSKVGIPRIQNCKGVQPYKALHGLFSTPSRTLCDRAASERENTRPTPSPKDHTKGQT